MAPINVFNKNKMLKTWFFLKSSVRLLIIVLFFGLRVTCVVWNTQLCVTQCSNVALPPLDGARNHNISPLLNKLHSAGTDFSETRCYFADLCLYDYMIACFPTKSCLLKIKMWCESCSWKIWNIQTVVFLFSTLLTKLLLGNLKNLAIEEKGQISIKHILPSGRQGFQVNIKWIMAFPFKEIA